MQEPAASGAARPSEPPLIRVAEAASTNDELISLAHRGAVAGTAFTALRQTAGRGRRGRAWVDLSGRQVFVSVLHHSRLQPAQLAGLTLDVGSAVADVVRRLGLPAQLKWPNDILLDGKKVGGILCELIDLPHCHAVVVGLGMNLQTTSMPADLPNASTIAAALPDDVELDLDSLVVDFTRAVRAACAAYDERGAPDVAAWAARSDSIGRRFTSDGRVGTVMGVALDGALWVQWDGASAPERFVAGDLEPAAPGR